SRPGRRAFMSRCLEKPCPRNAFIREGANGMNAKPILLVLGAALSSTALAQAPPAAPTEKQAPVSKETIYGHQLMTDAERTEYRAKMRALKTPEERQALRAEHHKLMQERAKERGVTLPDMPPQQGMGQGMHQGMHQGMGQGMHQGTGQEMHKGMGQGAQQDARQPETTPPTS